MKNRLIYLIKLTFEPYFFIFLLIFLYVILFDFKNTYSWLFIVLIFFISVVYIIVNYKRGTKYIDGKIPLPIVISVNGEEDTHNMLKLLIEIIEKNKVYKNYSQNIKKYLCITKNDLMFSVNFDENVYNIDKISTFIKLLRYSLEKLKLKTYSNSEFYIAYRGRSSLAILVGSAIFIEKVKLFQFDDRLKNCYSVCEITDRKFKENTDNFEKFDIERINNNCEKLTVAVDMSAHRIKLSDESIQQFGDIIYMKSKIQGTISKQDDWLRYSREIFKVLNEAQQKYKEIRLIDSMPEAIGIMLGMASENYWKIMLTHYDPKTTSYKDIMYVNDIKFYSF